MSWLDVADLDRFYDSPLGQVARRLIRRRIRALWPDASGLRVLAVGYGTPYLRPFLEQAERVVAVMPAGQGASRWPRNGAGLVALAAETDFPLPDSAFDRVLLVHALEHSAELRPLLREIWRVLDGDGRLLAVVPNRLGLWARLEATPFGHGRPFSPSQLDRLLRENLFLPGRAGTPLVRPRDWRGSRSR